MAFLANHPRLARHHPKSQDDFMDFHHPTPRLGAPMTSIRIIIDFPLFSQMLVNVPRFPETFWHLFAFHRFQRFSPILIDFLGLYLGMGLPHELCLPEIGPKIRKKRTIQRALLVGWLLLVGCRQITHRPPSGAKKNTKILIMYIT